MQDKSFYALLRDLTARVILMDAGDGYPHHPYFIFTFLPMPFDFSNFW